MKTSRSPDRNPSRTHAWPEGKGVRQALYALLAASCLSLALAHARSQAPAPDPLAHKVATDLRLAIDAAQPARQPWLREAAGQRWVSGVAARPDVLHVAPDRAMNAAAKAPATAEAPTHLAAYSLGPNSARAISDKALLGE